MLQQTQVVAVAPYYHAWLRRFPDFAVLARASENDVLHAWQGLGYYTRARNLHAVAKLVEDRNGGKFPSEVDEMLKLPGVGKYTAHAVASFAFDQSRPIVEANTARVLARLFDLQISIDQAAGQKALWNYAAFLTPKTWARDYNSALTDLGALICLPRPKCSICPVKRFCRAKKPGALPIRKRRLRIQHLTEDHAFVFWRKKILLERAERRWRGMWILPPLRWKPATEHAVHKSVFPFTNHRIVLRIFLRHRHRIDNCSQRWFSSEELDRIPIPSPHRRAIVDLLAGRKIAA